MKSATAMAALLIVAGCLHPGPAHACGDKLSMISGGVSFGRINQSRHRGSVVLLDFPESQLRAADSQLDLKGVLERAGHRVRVVVDPAGLSAVLQDGAVDVVLADPRSAGRLQQVAAESATAGAPVFLSVLYKPSDDDLVAAAGQGTCVARADRQHGHQLLDAIDRILARRDKGLPAGCVVSVAAR